MKEILIGKLNMQALPHEWFTIGGTAAFTALAIVAIIATFTWRRTGSSLPGALICGVFVTWYVVAGTATQAAF